MAGDTEIVVKTDSPQPESGIKGISIRAVLALMITGTGCLNVLVSIWVPGAAISSDFMMFWSGVVGYYFGKQSK